MAGTTITAAWSNANNRDQVITPFASAAARASAISSPVDGMFAYLQDTNFLTHYNGSVWVPANNNLIASQILTADSTSYTVDTTSDFALTGVVVEATRNYAVTLSTQYNTGGAAAWVVNFHVGGTLTDRFCFINETAARRWQICTRIIWQPTSGTKNVDVRLDFSTGSNLVLEASATNSRQFFIEDIGPR